MLNQMIVNATVEMHDNSATFFLLSADNNVSSFLIRALTLISEV